MKMALGRRCKVLMWSPSSEDEPRECTAGGMNDKICGEISAKTKTKTKTGPAGTRAGNVRQGGIRVAGGQQRRKKTAPTRTVTPRAPLSFMICAFQQLSSTNQIVHTRLRIVIWRARLRPESGLTDLVIVNLRRRAQWILGRLLWKFFPIPRATEEPSSNDAQHYFAFAFAAVSSKASHVPRPLNNSKTLPSRFIILVLRPGCVYVLITLAIECKYSRPAVRLGPCI
ncbi:hypothetical protein IW262DRAFT_348434 [Armillaria fumosa]|nr:hypothetical protein IW262DRAFT_348434 [Armillaria fumosa]